MKRWLALLLVVIAAVAFVVVPVYLIFPFRPQTPRALEIGYALRRWSPVMTLAAVALGLTLVVLIWRHSRRWWARAFAVILLLPVFPAAWFARQNHFEWMFAPVRDAAYARAGEAAFVNDGDMVLAVGKGEEAAGYPVNIIAYHHIVQDTVGAVPIVATY